jgi:hypothetical protein
MKIDWTKLYRAFENNSPLIHSYMHKITGEVIRMDDSAVNDSQHSRVASSEKYVRIEPVGSAVQFKWLEGFIATVENSNLASELVNACNGPGAFKRFKEILLKFPDERERWFQFRQNKIHTIAHEWLVANQMVGQPVPARSAS